MSSELSVQERLAFDQIIEDFDRPAEPLSPALRFVAGVVVAAGGFALLLAAIQSPFVAFLACLVMTAGGCLSVHARLRLDAFPSVQFPTAVPNRRVQRRRPVPGRPRRL